MTAACARRSLPTLLMLVLLLVPPAPAAAQQGNAPVGDALRGPITSDGDDLLRDRGFIEGRVNLPEPNAGVLMQPQGRDWRRWHEEPITFWGGWIILGFALLLFLFTALRGRIPLRRGFSGETITRFGAFERANHWMTAVSFLVAALSGLVILYGNLLLKPLIGAGAFSTLAEWSAYAHMGFAIPFVLGAVLMAILWLWRNLPTRVDMRWLRKAGGFLPRSGHASAYKFNAGQKLVFWSVFFGMIVLLATGLSLMFPFFWLGVIGMQWAQAIHAIAGILLIAVIVGHIWIGTIGMVGAIDAMWSGRVDRNWAEEHHDLWVEERRGSVARGPGR